jgi:TPR repeat protein
LDRAFLALTPFGVAGAGPLEDGRAAFQRHDYAVAVQVLRPLAEEGNITAKKLLSEATFDLGLTTSDGVQTFNFYRKAAEIGNALAQMTLGERYNAGRDVPQDYSKAAFWYGLAAEQGEVNSQYELGCLYEAGRGVSKDYVKAHMWFNLAASSSPATLGNRNLAETARDQAAAKMTPAQIAEAQKLASDWVPK